MGRATPLSLSVCLSVCLQSQIHFSGPFAVGNASYDESQTRAESASLFSPFFPREERERETEKREREEREKRREREEKRERESVEQPGERLALRSRESFESFYLCCVGR